MFGGIPWRTARDPGLGLVPFKQICLITLFTFSVNVLIIEYFFTEPITNIA